MVMPIVKKMSAEEAQALESKNGAGVRAAIEQEYDGYLADFSIGEYAEVSLADDENKTTVRNRLNRAAGCRGWVLKYIRTSGPVMRFKIENEPEMTERDSGINPPINLGNPPLIEEEVAA
jgi:hypothetical protein